jgi:hypothetical protein
VVALVYFLRTNVAIHVVEGVCLIVFAIKSETLYVFDFLVKIKMWNVFFYKSMVTMHHFSFQIFSICQSNFVHLFRWDDFGHCDVVMSEHMHGGTRMDFRESVGDTKWLKTMSTFHRENDFLFTFSTTKGTKGVGRPVGGGR